MTTLAKVKSVQANGIYKNPNGVDLGNGQKGFYKFIYEFDDSETLSANHKSKTPFPEGTEVEYEIKGTNDYGSWGSVSKPKSNGFSKGDSKGIKIGHAINNAVQIIGFKNGDFTKNNIKEKAKVIYQISEELNQEL